MSNLRIAIWHNLPSGGGKRQLYYHVKGLVERGHYVESWCPDTADQKFLPLGELVTEHVIPLSKSRGSYHDSLKSPSVTKEMLTSLEQHCRSCAAEIARGGFDVLYANACMFLRTTPIASFVGIPSALYLGEPYRAFYEAMPELPWIAPQSPLSSLRSPFNLGRAILKARLLNGARVQARAELEYAKAFDTILVNSSYSRETVLRTYNVESKVCYLGIEADLYKPSGETKENFVVGLGTIYSGKGIDRAIRAVGEISTKKRPALVWIGNGASEPAFSEYITLAKRLQVEFLPQIHISDAEVISYLSKAKAMLYTSRLEPFGLAPLEANACGTPVVAIAEGGVRETIRDGINGFLVPEDDPPLLARFITKFLDDPQLSLEMGETARRHVLECWSMTRCVDNIESALCRLVEHRKERDL